MICWKKESFENRSPQWLNRVFLRMLLSGCNDVKGWRRGRSREPISAVVESSVDGAFSDLMQ